MAVYRRSPRHNLRDVVFVPPVHSPNSPTAERHEHSGDHPLQNRSGPRGDQRGA